MITAVLALLAAWAVSVAAPGPDFVAVLRNSVAQGRRQGAFVSLGVVSGIACWATMAMVGLSALLARYEHLYLVIRTVGALFLLAYGVRILLHAARPGSAQDETARTGQRSAYRAWRLGLFTNLANPKAVFFGALFATLLPHSLGTIGRIAVLAVMLVMALGWFLLVTSLASLGPVVSIYRRAARRVDAVLGVAFAGLGAALLVER